VDFVLIGGWAVYFYAKTLKSKDIDLLVNFDQLPRLGKLYALSKNERLKKYEAIKDELQIDIYLPHYSVLGIPVEKLLSQVKLVEGFKLLSPDYLLALKFYTLSQRGRTPKGRKDFLDAVSLIRNDPSLLSKARKLVESYGFGSGWETFTALLKENLDLPELDFNRHQFAKFKELFSTSARGRF